MTSTCVDKLMSRLALVLCLVTATACGGKKNGKTTPDPKAGSGDQSMKDPADPTGGPATPGDPTGTPTGPGTPTNPGDPNTNPAGPPVAVPNQDPDPAAVKSQVDAQLTIAKGALSQATPDADGAIRAAKAALALDSTNVEAAAYVAFGYYHKRLYDTAELVLDDLFKREAAKNNAMVYYVYGLVYDRTNRPERAFKAYSKAVELDGRHASALVNLGVHQLKNTQYAEAQKTFERLTKEFNRADAITLTSLGSAYRGRASEYPPGAPERDQLVRQAEAQYKRAMQANGNYGPAYYNLGLLYLDTDPYPGVADTMARLNAAKGYFDQYKNMPGVDMKLYDTRAKDVDRLIKKAQKKAKKPPAGGAAPAPTPKKSP
jgi:tetratricopeptide (TPR) repeat protein